MPTIKIADKPTLDTVATNVNTVSTNVTTIKNEVQNSTYGLQAIKNAIGSGGSSSVLAFPRKIANGSKSMNPSSWNFLYTASEKCYLRVYCDTNSYGGWDLVFSLSNSSSYNILSYVIQSQSYNSRSTWYSYAYKCISDENGILTFLIDKNESIYIYTSSSMGLYYCAYTFTPQS